MNHDESLELCDKLVDACANVIDGTDVLPYYLIRCFTGMIWASMQPLDTESKFDALIDIRKELLDRIRKHEKGEKSPPHCIDEQVNHSP